MCIFASSKFDTNRRGRYRDKKANGEIVSGVRDFSGKKIKVSSAMDEMMTSARVQKVSENANPDALLNGRSMASATNAIGLRRKKRTSTDTGRRKLVNWYHPILWPMIKVAAREVAVRAR